jgi:5'(3')-deoxyribonucleotidase
MRDKSKKLIYVDMDGVLADFIKDFDKQRAENPEQLYPQSQYGFFMNLKPMKDAIESFKMLENHFDMWILTRPSVQNPLCYTEKAIWIKEKLGFDIQRKTIMCCDKSLLKGDYGRPMILKFGDRYHLVAGNTRLCTAAAMGMTPKVLIAEV